MPGFESLSLGVLAWIIAALALAGLLQGALGFGFPFVATPLVAIVSDMRTAVITVLLPTMVTTFVTLATSGPIGPVLKRFWMMPLYAIMGTFFGARIFVAAPNAPYSLLLALIIIAYLNIDRFTGGDWPRVRRHERLFAPLAGVTGGLFEGTANVAAPPLIIFYLALGLQPALLVQGMCICFIVGKATQLVVLTVHGGVTPLEWAATLPFALVGASTFFIGLRLRNRLDAQTFRVWVRRALLVIALFLLARYCYEQLV